MSDNVPPGPFRFLNLPVDIRLMVYEEYFFPSIKHHAIDIYDPVDATHHTGDSHQCNESFDPKKSTLTLTRITVPSALPRTNRSIYLEAQPFRDTLNRWLPMPEITLYSPCRGVDTEISYLFGMIGGLFRIFYARPINEVKFCDVADGVRASWRKGGWKFLHGEGGEDVARAWVAEVVHRMVTRRTRELPCRVSWPDTLLARDPGRNVWFAWTISRYLDRTIDLKME